MLTEFGKFCRKLRIDHGELLKDMADKLGVTSAYLSAVEVGKRNVPCEWAKKISQLYSLNQDEMKILQQAIANSQLQIKIDLRNKKEEDKALIIAFVREFEDLNENEKNKIKEILLKKK